MNKNIDLTKILKDCPKGIKLYSIIHGEVTLITDDYTSPNYPISVRLNNNKVEIFTSEGKLLNEFEGECVLFPSKDQRDWSKFTAPWYKKEKFDPETLKPFDKVLVRNDRYKTWRCDFYSYTHDNDSYPYIVIHATYKHCIPYNEDTKYLVGTTYEAPEYYRYWEN